MISGNSRLLFESHSKVNGLYQENIYSGSASNFNQLRNNNSSQSKLLSQLSPLPSGLLFNRQLSAAHADLEATEERMEIGHYIGAGVTVG